MKTTIKILLALAAISATMYAEYYFPLLGIVAGGLLLVCTTMIKENVGLLLILTATLMYCSTFFYLSVGLRVIHHQDSVQVVTPFFPIGKSLGRGIRIDTLELAYSIEETYWNKYEIQVAPIFVLTAKEDSTQIVFRNAELIRGTQLQLKSYKTQWGNIDVCEFIDETGVKKVYDLYGQDINAKDYSPHIIAYKPDYYYYPN